MNTQAELKLAHQRLDNLKALSNKDLLERAWNELSALCGSNKGPPKEWTMTIPVDADRDSDVLFGEVLMRFVKLETVTEKATEAEKMFDVMSLDGIKHWLSPRLLELYPEIHTALKKALADQEAHDGAT